MTAEREERLSWPLHASLLCLPKWYNTLKYKTWLAPAFTPPFWLLLVRKQYNPFTAYSVFDPLVQQIPQTIVQKNTSLFQSLLSVNTYPGVIFKPLLARKPGIAPEAGNRPLTTHARSDSGPEEGKSITRLLQKTEQKPSSPNNPACNREADGFPKRKNHASESTEQNPSDS